MTAGGDSSAAVAAATVNIRCSDGSRFSVQTTLDATVGSFKAAVAEKCEVPAEQQLLICKGLILKDNYTLKNYGVESDHTIHLVRGAVPTTTNLGASSVPNTTSGVAGLAGSNDSVDFGGEAGLGVNGLAGSVASGLFGNPDLDQIRQQLTQNPSMMREMMNTPFIQSLMSDLDLLLNLVTSNPHMREVLDRNPDLAHILDDPSTLRQSLEAIRNPEIMRKMMRNTDRAMSNIEASPEGFNMLRRMCENVQEPFLNATTLAGDAGNDSGSNPLASLLGNQGTTQSRDQLPATGSQATSGSTVPKTDPLPNPWSNTRRGTQIPNTRSVPTSDAQTPRTAGLGGLRLPELGTIPGPAFFNQAMRNLAVSQMMQSLISNPQCFQILGPQLHAVLESTTQLREMLQNSEFHGQLTSPETLQQLVPFHQSLLSQIGRRQLSPEQNQTGGATGTTNTIEPGHLMNMFGGLGPDTLGILPPEELFATQLSQLREMGFFDTQENICALNATHGNVHAAVERLQGNLGQ